MFCGEPEDYIIPRGKFIKIVDPNKEERYGYAHPVCILDAAYTVHTTTEIREKLRDWLRS